MAPLEATKRRRAPEGAPGFIPVELDAGATPFREGRDRLLNPLSPSPNPHFNGALQQCVYPHILSFNTFADCYVEEMVKELPFIYVDPYYDPDRHEANPYYKPSDYLKLGIADAVLGYPQKGGMGDLQVNSEYSNRLLPRHCRESHVSYGAPLHVSFVCWRTGDENNVAFKKTMVVGQVPVMVKSNRCSLSGMSPTEMVKAGEDLDELGGYFIINGNERVLRFVIQQKTNYPIALKRESFRNREIFATDLAVLLRSQRQAARNWPRLMHLLFDGTCTSNILLDTEDGRCCYRILLNRQEHFCPFLLLLRCVGGGLSLQQFKLKFMEGSWSDITEATQLHALFEEAWGNEKDFVDTDIMEHRPLHQLGQVFWRGVAWLLPPGSTYEDAGRFVIDRYVLVHVKDWASKFETLLLMFRKLRQLRAGKIPPESMDAFSYQEVVLPGQILASVLKDALFSALIKLRTQYTMELRQVKAAGHDPSLVISSNKFFDAATDRCASEIGHKVNYFMATGNIRTNQLDLQQVECNTLMILTGQLAPLSVGTLTVRKLLGESWGFLCPVHTPDGAPCGLLLHLSQFAQPVAVPPDRGALAAVRLFMKARGACVDLEGISGLPPSDLGAAAGAQAVGQLGRGGVKCIPLVVDGVVVCKIRKAEFGFWFDQLRHAKGCGLEGFKTHWELVGFDEESKQFEGIFMFTMPGRLVRPVKHLASGRVEFIGPLQQPWMSIACRDRNVAINERSMKAHLPIIQELLRDQSTGGVKTEETENQSSLERLENAYQGLLDAEGDTSTRRSDSRTLSSVKESREALATSHVPLHYDYVELSPTAFLSVTAALTPFSNHNQSPRNIYQCQMLKQTMGTPFHAIPFRHDNKAYRLITPQKPLLRTRDYRQIDFDDYPTGVNAVVAVMCYTGFDMEDAMILNKSSVERGLFHGCVYKTKIIDAAPSGSRAQEAEEYQFSNTSKLGRRCIPSLDADGFPAIGAKVTQGKTLCRSQRHTHSTAAQAPAQQTVYKDDEPAYVDGVTLTSSPAPAEERVLKTGLRGCRASLRLRSVRKPIIGDKFASRHGQKGILSMLWPHEDMPFSESGLVPDILFNPHGFPSRMTIGMLIESMAGKAAAVHGAFQDATAFREFKKQQKTGNRWIDQEGHHGYVLRGERYRTPEEEAIAQEQGDTPVDYFGKALLASGYQYYGREELYSGVYGVPLTCHIFTGLIYYQRLRHMVTDKAQVRATGPIDSLTHQPVKGRKRHGGVRFGEMERDALIAHGAAALLQDRLLHCSDAHRAFCCPSCGSILSPAQSPNLKGRSVGGKRPVPLCRICALPCRLVQLPYIFRYLSNELASMNVTVRLELDHLGSPVKLEHEGPPTHGAGGISGHAGTGTAQVSLPKRQDPRRARGSAGVVSAFRSDVLYVLKA
ncbi:DNA-directed RNA polymerase I subunit RPA2, putative [Eimeria mitis]|uniref:DNA-directed RNA polymerase subunit beta n=1 Tax=Eimeria mitis TaxID=44415 RepID=U6K831_9EIME|nr:DNA-directed RNA polymerase I subunit RPA2, putative [Eimeria mitis]CDJ31653.1 DNA-directed RNA polymerase I subunit RPA2, putative [Eimeria mitis]